MSATHFTRETFAFLRDLAANNDRDWFARNRTRYDMCVREPALRFIMDFAPALSRISPSFRADPRTNGGSLFRIHRDTRFSKDKRPYKTHTGIQFRHDAGKDVHAPGFYLHIEPQQVFVGLGVWHPDGPALRKIRDALAADPAGWRRVVNGKRFRGAWSLAGESLSRPPRGYAADHPLIEDLRRKDFIAVHALREDDVVEPDFLRAFTRLCVDGAPFVRYLCKALDVEF